MVSDTKIILCNKEHDIICSSVSNLCLGIN